MCSMARSGMPPASEKTSPRTWKKSVKLSLKAHAGLNIEQSMVSDCWKSNAYRCGAEATAGVAPRHTANVVAQTESGRFILGSSMKVVVAVVSPRSDPTSDGLRRPRLRNPAGKDHITAMIVRPNLYPSWSEIKTTLTALSFGGR